MKLVYKFIYFELLGSCWYCYNRKSDDELGVIEYYGRWGQYVIAFTEGCVFNDQCLKDITDFLGQLNNNKRGTKAKERQKSGQ